ncbi:MAG: transglutaminase family protein [Porticoccaceae bacterium]|nr:transglutaminase family protein [Pseudomonadales bacterium]MCP5172223.1 transglutaminase family protein [Pseudomonadales bacterium]
MKYSMAEFLEPTASIDFENTAVSDFAARHVQGASSDLQKAVGIYYAVRDQIRYDPYNVSLTVTGLKASNTLARGASWCVPKAILMVACCRAQGIPARLGFADVQNHLSTERMRRVMQTDIFHWHGYASIFLENKWVKATPAFNIGLCEKVNIRPLEFDGLEDSIYHEFDQAGNKHMEYLRNRGEFADMPLAQLRATFAKVYGDLEAKLSVGSSFDKELSQEHFK